MTVITEGKAKIGTYEGKISKKLPVFYNPVMKNNRDISILLLNCVDKKDMRIGLPMEASGLRGIRFFLELEKGKIDEIWMNDLSEKAVEDMRQNLKSNGIDSKKIIISQKDANLFLLESNGFDYIDIDPFGTPNPFLDSAVKRIGREGILAVTATDTAPLAGTFPKTCVRKYWAVPSRTEVMHEIGLRILIRKVQLVGAQFEKALVPIFSYFKDHYFRVFFRCEKGKKKCDEVLLQHGIAKSAGPMWLGQLYDKKLARKMFKQNKEGDIFNFLNIISEEAQIDTVGFYDIHVFCKRNKVKSLPKIDPLISEIKKKGFKASRTHFRPNSIRSSIPEKELIKLILN